MRIELVYFARVREALGRDQESLEVPDDIHLSGLREQLGERGEAWRRELLDTRVLVAVNQAMTTGDPALCAGDEVAFFPPVTGG